MDRFEYTAETVKWRPMLLSKLNSYGNEGWELVQINLKEDVEGSYITTVTHWYTYTFKRKLNDTKSK
jgi:hypothetical protein